MVGLQQSWQADMEANLRMLKVLLGTDDLLPRLILNTEKARDEDLMVMINVTIITTTAWPGSILDRFSSALQDTCLWIVVEMM